MEYLLTAVEWNPLQYRGEDMKLFAELFSTAPGRQLVLPAMKAMPVRQRVVLACHLGIAEASAADVQRLLQARTKDIWELAYIQLYAQHFIERDPELCYAVLKYLSSVVDPAPYEALAIQSGTLAKQRAAAARAASAE